MSWTSHKLAVFSLSTRSSRWRCARCCSSRDRGSCSASRWQEHSPPPQTHPWSPSHPTCCLQLQPHPCRAAREAASLACRTTRFTSPGWVKLQDVSLGLYVLWCFQCYKCKKHCVIVFSGCRREGRRQEWVMFLDYTGAAQMKISGITAHLKNWGQLTWLLNVFHSLSSLSYTLFYECITEWT